MANQLTLNTASLEELKARVNALPEPEIMQDGKTATPTEATQTIVPDSGFGGLSSVTVNPIPDKYEDRTESLPQLNAVNGGTAATTMAAAVDNTDTLVSNEDALIEQAIAALEGKAGGSAPSLQEKTVTPTASTQSVTPDSGYDGLSTVTVNGDVNLIAENIAEGVSVFGITGTHSGGISEDEVCTVTINWSALGSPNTLYVYTINQYLNSHLRTIATNESKTFQVSKKSIMFVSRHTIEILQLKAIEGDVTTFSNEVGNFISIAFQINSDCELTLYGSNRIDGSGND